MVIVLVPSPALGAPMRRRQRARSTISGSRAAFFRTVVPLASVAAISAFSVAPTDTKVNSNTAPVRRPPPARGACMDIAIAQVHLGPHRLKRLQVQIDRARANGTAPRQ